MSPLDLRHLDAERDGPGDEEHLRRLFEAAGPPPPAPELEIARLQEAARAEWRRRYGWRRRERLVQRWSWAAAAAVAIAAIGLFLAVRSQKSNPAPAAVAAVAVELVRGEASLDGRPLAPGERLGPGSVVRTGSSGRAALALGGGRSLRLDGESELRIASAERLELERGALYVDSAGAPAARAPEIVTPLGSFRELGTQFEVRLLEGDGARLRVREGAVAFERAAPAGAGEELLVAADGELRRGPVATHGEAWDWVLEAAPMPAIEGWTLARYLEWLARETGWRVAFADAGAAELARAVVLHGSIERLTPAESSAAVLGSAGFEHRLDDGILSVAVRTPK